VVSQNAPGNAFAPSATLGCDLLRMTMDATTKITVSTGNVYFSAVWMKL